MSTPSQVEPVETAIRTIGLGEVLTVDARSVAPSNIPDGTTYVGLESIGQGGAVDESVVVQANELKSAKFTFDPRHVLYGKLRPNLGKVARPMRDGVCSTDIYPLLPREGLDRNYLAHYLLRPETIAKAASRTTGVNLPRISAAVLKTFDIPLPPLPDQRRIADILDRADDLRTKRRRALTLSRSLERSLFWVSFMGEGASEHPVSVKLGELIVSSQNGLYKPSGDYGSGAQILRIADFSTGEKLSLRNLNRVRLNANELERFELRANDLVINRVNAMSHIGKSALVEEIKEPTVFESNMMRIRLDFDRVDAAYVLSWLSTNSARGQIRASAKQAINQASINQGDVARLELPLPGIEQQRSFVRKLASVEKLGNKHSRNLAKLDELFVSLQHRAFSGEL